MRQRSHRPSEPYQADSTVIDGQPVYEQRAVPDGLLTLKQLDKLGRKYGPDQKPAGWLRYIPGGPQGPIPQGGETRLRAIAPLYELTASAAKRPCTPAQRPGFRS